MIPPTYIVINVILIRYKIPPALAKTCEERLLGLLKVKISQNTSTYCQYVSWQLVSP